MKIDLHMIMYNEEKILPLILEYYGFCNLFLYDNKSTDNSVNIAKSLGAVVSDFGDEYFNDDENLKVKNNCWKGSQADWVIVCDTDEVFYKKDLLNVLSNEKATIIKSIGFDHYSHDFPKNILDIKTGFFNKSYDKSVCFRPNEIKEINYNHGCHDSNPKGNVVWSENDYYLRHYRCIGGVDMLVERHKMYTQRLSKFNLKRGMGGHYINNEKALRKGFGGVIKNKCIIFNEKNSIKKQVT